MGVTSCLFPVLQENAISNRHLWHLVDSREACHLAETQYCQVIQSAIVPAC